MYDGFSGQGGSGIWLENSTLHAWSSRIVGGDAHARFDEFVGQGGPGLLLRSSHADLFGGPGSEIRGGRGLSYVGDNTPGGAGLSLNHSQARIQASIPISGGLDGLGTIVSPDIDGDDTSTFTFDMKVFPTLTSSAQRVQIGSAFTLTLEGNPGGYQVLWLSLRTGPTTTFRGVDGFGLLDRTQLFKVASEVLPPSAASTLSFHVPSQTALLGSTLFFQAAERFSPGFAPRSSALVNQFAIGNPVLVTVTN
jgi:hypothetical protein